jgi:nucleoside-diphosphate-sugar epimerase
MTIPLISMSPPPVILITGAAGFVISNIAHEILTAIPKSQVIILDSYQGDSLASELFREYGGRAILVQGDIRDSSLLREILARYRPLEIIHGAAVTHQAQLERQNPAIFVDVNINGTVALLEACRVVGGLRRFTYISTGGVYGEPNEHSPDGPQKEDGPFNPPELYAVSKFASELIVRRYGTIFGIDTLRVRFADVFGPMERATGARVTLSLPYAMMRSVIEGRALKIAPSALSAKVDIISADEIAIALTKLLLSPVLPFDAYNISSGQHVSIGEILETFRAIEPRFRFDIAEAERADVTADPTRLRARYNAYDISRVREVGWQPSGLSEQLARYRDWVMADPSHRCPIPPRMDIPSDSTANP